MIIIWIIELLVLVLSLTLKQYIAGAICLTVLAIIRLLNKFGNGSFLLEVIYFHACLTCLAMPVFGYVYFNQSNPVAVIWRKFMPVPEEAYFTFLIPACIALSWAFFMFRGNSRDDYSVIRNIISSVKKDVLTIPLGTIRALFFISLLTYSVSSFLPEAFRQVSNFVYFSFYTSIFYIYYHKKFPHRHIYLIAALAFVIFDALRGGMFTIIAYMGGILLILLLADVKIKYYNRIILFSLVLFFLGFIQMFKIGWREENWLSEDKQRLAMERSLKAAKLNKYQSVLYPIYVRANQGFNIALVQRRIPQRVDYLGGEYLGLTFIASFVPRLFWPDKPMAGGKANMKMYTGVNLKGVSMNVGPFGEAYGSFGNFFGCLYVFMFGLFIRFSYLFFLKKSSIIPVLLLWMPVLFYQIIYIIETDSMQAFNSLIKGSVFVWVLYKIFPSLFPTKSQI